MVTPGYKPWAESATKDDPVFKNICYDRHDLFEKYYEFTYAFKLKISKEVFDVLAFSLSY